MNVMKNSTWKPELTLSLICHKSVAVSAQWQPNLSAPALQISRSKSHRLHDNLPENERERLTICQKMMSQSVRDLSDLSVKETRFFPAPRDTRDWSVTFGRHPCPSCHGCGMYPRRTSKAAFCLAPAEPFHGFHRHESYIKADREPRLHFENDFKISSELCL